MSDVLHHAIHLPGGLVAHVDMADVSLVEGYNWRVLQQERQTYARAWTGGRHLYLHRLIADAPPGKVVDHRDGNGLNNQRSNLRLATHSQNQANAGPNRRRTGKSSRFKGVYYDRSRQLWAATLHADGKTRALGRYPTENGAAEAYNAAALEVWGEFALLNRGVAE